MNHDQQRERQLWLIAALQAPQAYDHPVSEIVLIETHISYVLLTGQFAYKIKKAVNLGFLDFSTLDKRRHCCEEELRLNRRTAPQLYLETVPITGSPQQPRMGGTGAVIEYAVRMRRFPQQAMAAYLVSKGSLSADHMDQIAATLAAFHGSVAVADHESPWGTPQQVQRPVMDNFETIAARFANGEDLERLSTLRRWSEQTFTALEPVLAARKRDGFIRECHGDMHLGNLVLLDDGFTAFDCIEFNPGLRWIDVMSEAAFLTMDLEDHGRGDLAWRFLNTYLAHTGDYHGMTVMAYYMTYRAMVRAKVSCIRLGQSGINNTERQALEREYNSYIRLAERCASPPAKRLIITHGLSGSGKTTVAQALAVQLGAVHIRSDIERKRLYGMTATQRSESNIDEGLYSREAGERTYARLAELATDLLINGYPVVVDAAFLHLAQRARFLAIAREQRVPLVILDIHAPASELRARIARRQARALDASEADLAVLDNQISRHDALSESEQAYAVTVDTTRASDSPGLLRRVMASSSEQNP